MECNTSKIHCQEVPPESPPPVTLPSQGTHGQLSLASSASLELSDRLRSVMFNIRQSTTRCHPRYFAFSCKCGSEHYMRGCHSPLWSPDLTVVRSGCMRYNCPDCAAQITKRRAKRAKERLDKGRQGRAILYTVLTVPPHLRETYVDRKAWRKLIRGAWRVLREEFAGEFAVESSHPHGDPRDEGEDAAELFHPHVNFLWVQRRGFSPYIDVDRLRVRWSALLGVEVSDVWHHYYKDPRELQRRIEYVMRTFPGFAGWVGSVRWYGQYPRKLSPHVWKCDKCGEPYSFAGMVEEGEYTLYLQRTQETRAGPDADLPAF